MKILQIIYESFGSPFGFGGAGVRAYEIYRRLRNRHDITLLCMKYPGARDGDIHGLKHVFAGSETANLTKSVISYSLNAARYVKQYGDDFDIVIENFLPSTPFFSPLLIKRPVILQVQGIMGRHSLRKFSLLYSFPMFIFEKFYPLLYNRFIFVSDVTMKKLMKGSVRKARLCRVIPNGVNEELLNVVPEEGDYILFFSRIDVYTKGLDILLSAFGQLSPAFPDLRLVLAGYEFDKFDRLVSGLPSSVKRRVEYAGFVTGDEKTALLSRARVIVLPSRHESAPISIIEAAACGKPIVVSDIPELKFAEENEIGINFESGSADSLRRKIEVLLRDEQLRSRLGKRGRAYSRNFLWDTIATEFENTLELTANAK